MVSAVGSICRHFRLLDFENGKGTIKERARFRGIEIWKVHR